MNLLGGRFAGRASIWLFAALVFVAGYASACVNTYEGDILVMMYRGNPEQIAQTVRDLEAANAKAPSVQSRNDLAVAYIISGKYPEAVALLTALEQDHPGLSRTASNLGTALELSGKNSEALHWIKQGVARDPNDHDGTEWLHVKVLEAKVALEQDPAWLETHSVLGMDFGADAQPRMPPSAQPPFADIEKAIDYQLKERLKFVTAPDAVVASLYRTRADIAYLQKSPLTPDYYQAALFFGATDALIKRRAEQFLVDAHAEKIRSQRIWIACALAAVLLLAGGLALRLRARRIHGAR